MMSEELGRLLAHFDQPDVGQSLADYAHAIVDDNILTKPTQATRKASLRFLRELYSLDQSVPLFRALRKLWKLDESSRPLVAILSAYGRDPTLRAAAPVILGTPVDSEVSRTQLTRAIKEFCDDTMADSTIDKVVRNAGSSFTQSGHLVGRVRKVRQLVNPTPTSITFALLLAYAAGTRGKRLLSSEFVRLIDADEDTRNAGHDWQLVDLTDKFPQWMASEEYRESYFEDPLDLKLKLDTDFMDFVSRQLRGVLANEKATEQSVVAVVGGASLYGFLHISELIDKVAGDIRGRLVFFFPGYFEQGMYSLLGARSGWNYLATPITHRSGE